MSPFVAPPAQKSDTKRALLIAGLVLICLFLTLFLAILAVRAFLLRQAIAQERQTKSVYGEPLLSGPLVTGGPTFGPGLHADLETTDHGWQWPAGTNQKDPKTPHYVFIAVHNKSDHAWNGVEAELAVYDRREHYLRQEPCSFGTLAAGETRQQSFGPTEPQDYDYYIVGYKGHP